MPTQQSPQVSVDSAFDLVRGGRDRFTRNLEAGFEIGEQRALFS